MSQPRRPSHHIVSDAEVAEALRSGRWVVKSDSVRQRFLYTNTVTGESVRSLRWALDRARTPADTAASAPTSSTGSSSSRSSSASSGSLASHSSSSSSTSSSALQRAPSYHHQHQGLVTAPYTPDEAPLPTTSAAGTAIASSSAGSAQTSVPPTVKDTNAVAGEQQCPLPHGPLGMETTAAAVHSPSSAAVASPPVALTGPTEKREISAELRCLIEHLQDLRLNEIRYTSERAALVGPAKVEAEALQLEHQRVLDAQAALQDVSTSEATRTAAKQAEVDALRRQLNDLQLAREERQRLLESFHSRRSQLEAEKRSVATKAMSTASELRRVEQALPATREHLKQTLQDQQRLTGQLREREARLVRQKAELAELQEQVASLQAREAFYESAYPTLFPLVSSRHHPSSSVAATITSPLSHSSLVPADASAAATTAEEAAAEQALTAVREEVSRKAAELQRLREARRHLYEMKVTHLQHRQLVRSKREGEKTAKRVKHAAADAARLTDELTRLLAQLAEEWEGALEQEWPAATRQRARARV